MFAREDGAYLTPEQVTKTFARLVKAIGVRRQRLHDLRHLSASFDALAGVPINVTSKRLGHCNPAFTMRVYQHLYAETATAAAEAAAEFFPARSAHVGGRNAPTLRPRDLGNGSEPPPVTPNRALTCGNTGTPEPTGRLELPTPCLQGLRQPSKPVR